MISLLGAVIPVPVLSSPSNQLPRFKGWVKSCSKTAWYKNFAPVTKYRAHGATSLYRDNNAIKVRYFPRRRTVLWGSTRNINVRAEGSSECQRLVSTHLYPTGDILYVLDLITTTSNIRLYYRYGPIDADLGIWKSQQSFGKCQRTARVSQLRILLRREW